VVGVEFFAEERLKTSGTNGGDDVAPKVRPDFLAMGAFFMRFVVVINVLPQINPTSKHFRAVRTLFIFGEVEALKMITNTVSLWGFVVTKSATIFFRVFLFEVIFSILFAFEKGETLRIFAPDGFFGMLTLDVSGVGQFVPDDFLAIKTLDCFFVPFNFCVHFFFVFFQVILTFEK